MGKSTYYVSVQARTINTQRGDAAYEFEIEAGDEELVQLRELFDSMDEFDQAGYWRAHLPYLEYHNDAENDGYDYYLKEVYNRLSEWGTEETKRHIATMDVNSM
ncbi:hydrolase [Cohnella sp. JJ-181]|uniref:hydrolase n=1 Tax=Cohnella rhizoplanae TaxID=2974897 RepID=UPI0022FF7AA9|nr:hydrolase [Cohnella sp. JJ-181]CAI6045014.1 hypothetical protein COHCIP112018_01242 [Cohnella sp. JJ-181]